MPAFHNLCKLQEAFAIDLSMLSVDLSLVQTWSLSSCLDKLVLIDQAGDMHVTDLHLYCELFPNQVLKSKNRDKTVAVDASQGLKGQNIYLKTCEYGDFPWRNKLVKAHKTGLEYQTRTTTVSIVAGQKGQGQVKSQGHRSKNAKRVTGFKAKSKKGLEPEKMPVKFVPAPEGVKGYSVERLSFNESQVSVVYLYNDQYVLCLLQMKDCVWKTVRYVDNFQ